MAEHPFHAVALAIKAFVVADRCGAVGFRRDDGFDPALFQVGSDRVSVVGLVGEKSIRCLLRKIDQRIVGFAVRRFAGREMEVRGISEDTSMKGKKRRVRRSRTSSAPSRSCTAAEWTTTFISKPSVSTRIWRLRPVTFLAASKPCGSSVEPPFEPLWRFDCR